MGPPVGAMFALPHRMLRVLHRRGQKIAGNAEFLIGLVFDGNRLEFVDSGVKFRHGRHVVMSFEYKVALEVQFVTPLGRQHFFAVGYGSGHR